VKTDAELQCLQDSMYKWIRPRDLTARMASIHCKGWSIVATSGCFDILHPGHVRFLREASMLGDWLFVLVNSDESVRRLKGPGRPIVRLGDRMEVLNALEPVGYMVTQEEDTPESLLEIIRPNLWVKGGDYQHKDLPERAVVERHGGMVRILPYDPGHSTTSLWARLEGHSEEPDGRG
jgi:D-beta-D-heptose 7-phosphate kinase / D-beta-D-heptose 1-phosphate adenosyltransferase